MLTYANTGRAPCVTTLFVNTKIVDMSLVYIQYAGGAVGRTACTGDGGREQALEQTQFRETEMRKVF